MFNTVLVPLDGSKRAEAAVPVALELINHKGELILLRSTLEMHLTTAQISANVALPQSPSSSPFYLAADAYLKTLKAQWSNPGIEIYKYVANDDPAAAILDIADQEDVELIVMTSHGASNERQWTLGSVTRKVLHSAPCPVLVVRDGVPIQRLLITLDGSEISQHALSPGMNVARALDLEVTLLQVLDQDEYKGMKADSEAYLSALADQYRQEEDSIHTAVASGPTAQTVLDIAKARQIDMIAMATHGRTGLARWIYGSTTEKIIHSTTCSLLIVRPPIHVLNHPL